MSNVLKRAHPPPVAGILHDFEQKFVPPFLELRFQPVLPRPNRAIQIIFVDQFAIQPRLGRIVAAHHQTQLATRKPFGTERTPGRSKTGLT